MIVAEELEPVDRPGPPQRRRTSTLPRRTRGSTGGSTGDPDERGPADPRGRGLGATGAARARLDAASASRSASLSRRARASSRAAARPSPTASWSAASCSTSTDPERRTLEPGRVAGEAGRPVQASSGRRPPRIDIPDKVAGTTPTCTTSGCRGCCTAGSCGRAARAPTATGADDRLDRRELDRAHPGRAGRPQERLPRRGRAEGVRRDPGGRPAEGDLGGEPDPAGHGQPLEADARPGQRRARRRRGSRSNAGNVDTALAVGGEDRLGDARVPLPGPHADRPGAARSPTARRPRRRSSRAASRWRTSYRPREPARAEHRRRCGSIFYEGASSFGGGARSRRSRRVGGADVAGRRQAGARAVDALGRARAGSTTARPS